MTTNLRQILEERAGVFVSGEEISRRLGTTRAAVWKQVQVLRRRGYEIEGARGAGYRMVARPDLVEADSLASRLGPGSVWKRFEILPRVDSTNTLAMDLAERGAPEGTVVVADEQTGGRGRLGRRWESPPGINLYVTLILRPRFEPYQAPRLTLVAAIALAQAVEESTGLEARLKWPNDLYLHGRKAAGILAEMAADPDGIRHVAIGVGVNVNGLEDDFPPELRRKATSLRIETGRKVSRVDLLAAFLGRMESAWREFRAGGFEALMPEWDRRSLLDGRRVVLRRGSEAERGIVLGIDAEGALRFRREGLLEEEPVFSGEIIEFER